MKKGNLSILFLSIFFLSACNDKFVEEAKKTQDNGINEKTEQEVQEIRDETIYKELEKPMEEVINENDLEEKELLDNIETIEEKTNYTDANEFAAYTAAMLFNFETLKINPEEFYYFLKNYSSQSNLEELPKDKEDALSIYENVQSLFKENKAVPESYVISKVTLNKNKREGYFYRKIKTDQGDQFYITTIVKEEDGWKYSEDSPSPPFEIKEDMKKGE